jgi:hypothetical protein
LRSAPIAVVTPERRSLLSRSRSTAWEPWSEATSSEVTSSAAGSSWGPDREAVAQTSVAVRCSADPSRAGRWREDRWPAGSCRAGGGRSRVPPAGRSDERRGDSRRAPRGRRRLTRAGGRGGGAWAGRGRPLRRGRGLLREERPAVGVAPRNARDDDAQERASEQDERGHPSPVGGHRRPSHGLTEHAE